MEERRKVIKWDVFQFIIASRNWKGKGGHKSPRNEVYIVDKEIHRWIKTSEGSCVHDASVDVNSKPSIPEINGIWELFLNVYIQ